MNKLNLMAFDFRTLPRCQATSKQTGKRCRQAAMKGKRVCYFHGGKSPGPPKGSKNALTHGLYSKEIQDILKECNGILKKSSELLGDL